MRNSMLAAVVAMIAGGRGGPFGAMTEAISASEHPRRNRQVTFTMKLDAAARDEEIAKWNAEVDRKKAEKKAAKLARNQGKARRKRSF